VVSDEGFDLCRCEREGAVHIFLVLLFLSGAAVTAAWCWSSG